MTALLVERNGDVYYTGPLDAGMRLALRDRWARMVRKDGKWMVRLCDDEQGLLEAEWGNAENPDDAWRFALGAMFGPIDEEYSERVLRRELDRVSSGNPEPPADEHVIVVGFEVAGNSRQQSQATLLRLLGEPDGLDMIGYWIAEDDRVDGTDNNSAVFVPKGSQQATTDRLARREPHARYVVLVGNPGAALTLYGPFEEHEDAVRFADDTFKDQSWSVDALMGTLA